MKQTTFKCDGKDCKNVRQLSNHWWIGRLSKHSNTTIEVMAWDEERAYDPDVSHLCGYQCVNLWQQQQMERIQEGLKGV